jgi:hypothetical protein
VSRKGGIIGKCPRSRGRCTRSPHGEEGRRIISDMTCGEEAKEGRWEGGRGRRGGRKGEAEMIKAEGAEREVTGR